MVRSNGSVVQVQNMRADLLRSSGLLLESEVLLSLLMRGALEADKEYCLKLSWLRFGSGRGHSDEAARCFTLLVRHSHIDGSTDIANERLTELLSAKKHFVKGQARPLKVYWAKEGVVRHLSLTMLS